MEVIFGIASVIFFNVIFLDNPYHSLSNQPKFDNCC